MDNQKIITIDTDGNIYFNFGLSETLILRGMDFCSVKVSKELAEKYLAQLSKTLEDLDRAEEEFRDKHSG